MTGNNAALTVIGRSVGVKDRVLCIHWLIYHSKYAPGWFVCAQMNHIYQGASFNILAVNFLFKGILS